MILRANGSGTQFIASKLLESLGIKKTELNVVVQTNDLESIKHMIVGGVGISIMFKIFRSKIFWEVIR